MGIKNFFKYIFSIDTHSTNRIIIYFLGIRFRHLKPEVKEKYTQYTCPVTEIPKAEGILRKIQLANLKMMVIFDKICKENNFQYWLDEGNLLGAVRHSGFIPWDDDVDFGMIRDDYEKFIELYKNGIPEYDDFYLEFNNNGKDKCFLKIRHKKLPNMALDVFPYDYYYRAVKDDEKIDLTAKIIKIRSAFKYRLLQPFYINNPDGMRKRFAKLWNEKIMKGNKVNKDEKPSIVLGIDYPHLYDNHFFNYDTIFPLKTIPFENFDFPCPNDEKSILKQIYGDFMSIPDDCYPRHVNPETFDETVLDEFIKDFV